MTISSMKLSQSVLSGDSISLVWDLECEQLTIGGAFVLRQEGEMLAQITGKKNVILQIICQASDRVAANDLANKVFCSSSLSFRLVFSSSGSEGWPSKLLRSHSDFSYFSFIRLIGLHQESGIKPELRWNSHTLGLAKQARASFSGRLICIHLRFIAPFLSEESNADGSVWQTFFNERAEPGFCNFLLIGDDELPRGFTLRPGVIRAKDINLELIVQLALVSIADGFMGMASGLCTIANLSDVPHVIFKHPAHHAAEMEKELGSVDQFPFAGSQQKLWRREVDQISLTEAFNLISL